MAAITIRINDETYDAYVGMNPTNPRAGIEKQLERFKEYPPTERALVFRPSERRELERLFGRPIEDQAAFVGWVKGLLSVGVEGYGEVETSEKVRKRVSAICAHGKMEEGAWVTKRVGEFLETL